MSTVETTGTGMPQTLALKQVHVPGTGSELGRSDAHLIKMPPPIGRCSTAPFHSNEDNPAGKSTLDQPGLHAALQNPNRVTMGGSMHVFTDGIGRGRWRVGPASPRFETPRGHREAARPFEKLWSPVSKPSTFGFAKSWKHAGPRGHRQRSKEARVHLTSGEVGAWSEFEHPRCVPEPSPIRAPKPRPRPATVASSTQFATADGAPAWPALSSARLLEHMRGTPSPRRAVTPAGVIPPAVRRHIDRAPPQHDSSGAAQRIAMAEGRLDPTFHPRLRQDHRFTTTDPGMFRRSAPAFGQIAPESAYYQNAISTELASDWSNSLRQRRQK